MVMEEEEIMNTPQPQAEATQEQAIEVQLSNNLTLLMPPKVEVDFMEWDQSKDEQGEEMLVPRLRRASISSYVPMKIFHEMLAGRAQILKLKSMDGSNTENTAEMMGWMVDVVLAVWQRTEPKMTRERFENGLQMDQVLELFNRFFGALMGRLGERGRFMQTLQNNRS